MPEKKTVERAKRDKREGKAPSTQAGEFVREEVDRIREGRHGARSSAQAIAIGLSKARRAGVKLPAPEKGEASESIRKHAKRDLKAGEHPHEPSAKRSRATTNALKRESPKAASEKSLSEHAKAAAKKRTAGERSAAAKKAARTRARGKSGD
jgi:hypothetical protein